MDDIEPILLKDLEEERKKCVELIRDYPGISQETAEFLARKIVGIWIPNCSYKKMADANYVDDVINRFGFMMNNRFGFIDRKGKFYGCDYACHERMLTHFGWDIKDIEQAGWVRIGFGGLGRNLYKLSAKQKAYMKKAGFVPNIDDSELPKFPPENEKVFT